MRILHRYILKEMIKTFALTLAGVTGVIAFGLVLAALQSKGLSPLSSLFYMALSLPMAVYMALALSAVLAATLTYGRLAADNEIMAAQASGLPLTTLFWPSMVLAIVASALSLGLAAWPLPESAYTAKRVGLRDIEAFFYSTLATEQKLNLRQPGGEEYQVSADRVSGDFLYGLTVKYRSQHEQYYCSAPYGQVTFDMVNKRATLIPYNSIAFDEKGKIGRGKHTIFSMPLPSDLPREEGELSLWDLLFAQRHPERTEKFLAMSENASDLAKANELTRIRGRTAAKFHERLATAIGCFGLVLIGAGLGILFHSGHLLTAFGVALVPYLFTTFLTMPAVKVAEKNVAAAPLLWLPNVVVVVAGLAMLAYLGWGGPMRAALRRVRGQGRQP